MRYFTISKIKCSIIKFRWNENTNCSFPVYLPRWIRVPSHRSHCVAMSGCVWLGSHIKHPTSSRKRPVCLRPSSSGFLLLKQTHISPFTANPAKVYHYISELTRQLFDAGIARIQPRVSSCFRVPINQSANASLHVTRFLYRGSRYSACSFPEERHVVSECCKSVSPCCDMISYRDKKQLFFKLFGNLDWNAYIEYGIR